MQNRPRRARRSDRTRRHDIPEREAREIDAAPEVQDRNLEPRAVDDPALIGMSSAPTRCSSSDWSVSSRGQLADACTQRDVPDPRLVDRSLEEIAESEPASVAPMNAGAALLKIDDPTATTWLLSTPLMKTLTRRGAVESADDVRPLSDGQPARLTRQPR